MPWTKWENGQILCLSCDKPNSYKPDKSCTESKHVASYNKHIEISKAWSQTENGRKSNKEKSARYRERHPNQAKEYNQSHKKERSESAWLRLWKYKLEAFRLLGGKCAHCGETDPRLLDINHKKGGGNKEGLFGVDMYVAIVNGKRSVEDLELRCCNGNRLYEYERGMRRNPPITCT